MLALALKIVKLVLIKIFSNRLKALKTRFG